MFGYSTASLVFQSVSSKNNMYAYICYIIIQKCEILEDLKYLKFIISGAECCHRLPLPHQKTVPLSISAKWHQNPPKWNKKKIVIQEYFHPIHVTNQ